jgi:15-cis-phytoene synthase
MLQLEKSSLPSLPMIKLASTEAAYELCRQVTAEFGKTFYLATLLMSVPKRQAIWAIYAWCRNTDEMVDGAGAEDTTLATLDGWEQQLESVFAGSPTDDYDVALVDTIARFPQLDIQPFREMIAGQRMDLQQKRYQNFDELSLYCYRVAGTVGLMSNAIVGVDGNRSNCPWNNAANFVPTDEAVALGIAKQLTNILRDVGEDAQRGRIYLPLDEMALFNYSEADLFNRVVNDNWRDLMRFQIQRARKYYQQAEAGIGYLSPDVRWPVWAALLLYQQILDAIERNNYDVFNYRAYVSVPRKLWGLPDSLIRAQMK